MAQLLQNSFQQSVIFNLARIIKARRIRPVSIDMEDEEAVPGGVDLSKAEVTVSAGRGVGKPKNIESGRCSRCR